MLMGARTGPLRMKHFPNHSMDTLKDLLLRDPSWTLAVAESLTCGQVQAAIGAISGASKFFAGGLTAYSLEQKIRHLGVERAVAEPVNSVSAQVAEQMARGVARLFGTDLGLATTGYAEPSPTAGVTMPFAWWAIYRGDGGAGSLRSGRVEFAEATERVEVQTAMAAVAINELIRYLEEVHG